MLAAAFLRFNQISSNPPSLTWDEAAWGYNAYSIGIDGKDEFGRFLPLNYLESFGDFKPPLYAYLDVVPVKIFGLNEFSTRFPSALFGTLTVFFTYFLVTRIFINSKNKTKYALLASLFLAISPWHILLSRAAFEANIANFLIVFGVWSFLLGIQEKKWGLFVSAISFGLSIYTFNTARVVSPLLVIVLGLIYRKKLLKIKTSVILSLILGFIVILPTLSFLFSPQADLRFKEVNIFSNIDTVKTANQEILNDNNAFYSKIIHNRRLLYSVDYLKHYFDNLSPLFLFITGDGNPKFSIQDVGQMYIWDIVFFILGIFILVRKKEDNWFLIPIWLLLAIVPAATARETPHALRIESSLPMFQILTAYGFVTFLEWSKKQNLKLKTLNLNLGKILPLMFYILLFANFSYFYHTYFYQYKYEYSGEWQYGYKESVDFVNKNAGNYKNIYITNQLGRPYIYYLFYGKVNPSDFRKNSKVSRDPFGFVSVDRYAKFNFVSNPTATELVKKNSLYITDKYNIPTNVKILKTFYLLNGDISLVAFTYD